MPTESGRLFYSRCSGLLNEFQDIKMEMQRLSSGENKLRIGYSCGVLNIFDIDRMERFKEKHLLDYTQWTEDLNDEIKERVLRKDRIKTMEGELIYKFTAERQGTGVDVDFHRPTAWSEDLHCVEIKDSIPWTVYAVCPEDKKEDPRIRELLDYYKGVCHGGRFS